MRRAGFEPTYTWLEAKFPTKLGYGRNGPDKGNLTLSYRFTAYRANITPCQVDNGVSRI